MLSKFVKNKKTVFCAMDHCACLLCGLHEKKELGEMLLCDAVVGRSKTCDRTMHVLCAGLDRVPKGKWYCPTCTKSDVMSSSLNAGDLPTVQSSTPLGGSLRASSYIQAPISNMRLTVANAPLSDIYVVMIDQSASLTTVIADCMRKHQITDVRKQYMLEVEVGSQRAKVTSVNDLRDGDKLHVIEVKASRDGDHPVRSASDRIPNSQPNAKRKCIDLIDDEDDNESDEELLSIQRHAKRARPNYEDDGEEESDDDEESDSDDEESDSDDEESDSDDEESDSDDEKDEWSATFMPSVHTRIRPGANNRHTIGRKVDSYDRCF